MPYVIVKLWPGKSEEQKKRLADRIAKDVMLAVTGNDTRIGPMAFRRGAAEMLTRSAPIGLIEWREYPGFTD